MKAVYYHADSHFAWGGSPGDVYKKHAARFKEQCHKYGMQVVHLTCDGHPQWGDENYSFPLDPKNIVANREEAFVAFLEKAPDGWYWFAEPDFLQHHPMEDPKDCDAVFLFRGGDAVPMTPSWRMATPKALPVFVRLRDEMRKAKGKDWHGDSAAFTVVWHEMKKPSGKTIQYLGCKIEFRKFGNYVKPGLITTNLLGMRKL